MDSRCRREVEETIGVINTSFFARQLFIHKPCFGLHLRHAASCRFALMLLDITRDAGTAKGVMTSDAAT